VHEKRSKWVTCEAAPGGGVTPKLNGHGSIAHKPMLVSSMEVRMRIRHRP
jgi:hypothetical protein